MTLYQAVRTMRALGWDYVRHYGTYELWYNGTDYVKVPNSNIIPKYLERMYVKKT